MTRPRTLALALAVAAAALLVGAGAALARTVFDRTADREAFAVDLAQRLGVSEEQLEQAWKDAAGARLDRLVEEGAITEEQATRLRERIDAGSLAGGPGPFGGPGLLHRGHGFGFGGPELGVAAEYLGLSVADLRAALRGGSSLAQVAQAQGKPVDGLKQVLLDAAKERLDAAEAAGRIDAERKQGMLDRLEARIDRLVERSGRMDRPGKRMRGAAPPSRSS